ncbi:MAG: MutS-related protein [Ferrimicrobium sp.]
MTMSHLEGDDTTLSFGSILFEWPGLDGETGPQKAPEYLVDLHLDQIVEAITIGRQGYDLNPIFYHPVRDLSTIDYRHEVFRDLENASVLEGLVAFSASIEEMRSYIAQADKAHNGWQRRRWFLEAVATYCAALREFAARLNASDLGSRGLSSFRDYLDRYLTSDRFTQLAAEASSLVEALSRVCYSVQIRGSRVSVRAYDGEADYSEEVLATFSRFRRDAVRDYRVRFPDSVQMNHVESAILDLVARLFGITFSSLDDFCVRSDEYLDETVRRFEREIQFYLAYLAYMSRFSEAGLRFCYPRMVESSKEVAASDTFDLALATVLVPSGKPVVANDFELHNPERIIVVSGPNQGGKTTFARTFGQLHHLGCIGCPVPGTSAQLFFFDQLMTHFEREEDPTISGGKLEDDLVRIRDILLRATPESIIVINEIFTSTTLHDATVLGLKVLERIAELDLLAVYVSFVDELASFSESTVSMVSTVEVENPAQRTFKVVRGPANGLAYAISLAQRYGVTYDYLMRRIER